MTDAAPAGLYADRNLLYGMLALQMGFVSRDALLSGMHAWVLAKDRPLGELLLEQHALTPQQRQVLDAVVAEHLQARVEDAAPGLVPVGQPSGLDGDPKGLTHASLQATIAAAELALATVADPASAVGTRYQTLRPHARGGLGVVSVARDVELGREVALKEIDGRHAGDSVSQRRFVREAEITGGLEHPGVVPVYGLGRYADGRPYYAMRFVRGETLQEAVRKYHAGDAAYTLRSLLTRFVAVCNAVAYAHSRGVIHRDLKPANVMSGAYGETLVVDWGLAKVVGRDSPSNEGAPVTEMTLQTPSGESSETQAGSALGTPSYMSPEQARGEVATIGRLIGRGGSLIECLVGIAIDGVASKADVALLDRAKPGSERIRSCLGDLQKLPALPDIAEKISLTERFCALEGVSILDRNGIDYFKELYLAETRVQGDAKPPDAASERFLESVAPERIDWDIALENANRWYDRTVVVLRIPDRLYRRACSGSVFPCK
jgi:tRNA A-37 threonylcarbamoyl transferase component Bud32